MAKTKAKTRAKPKSQGKAKAKIVAGRYVWYELLTTDPKAAQRFYKDVVGWKTQLWDEGDEPYTMWMVKDRPIGGVMTLPAEAKQMGAPPSWLGYVSTTDRAATIAKVKKLGGQVLNTVEIPKVGKIAILQDPQSAVFAVLEPEESPPGFGKFDPKVGDISWHELATSDYKGAFSFYTALFGWEKTGEFDTGGGAMYQLFGYDGATIGGMYDKHADQPGPPAAWLYYAKVPDVHKRVGSVTANGGQVLNGPMEVPGGDFIAQCMDPQGAAFAIHSAAKG